MMLCNHRSKSQRGSSSAPPVFLNQVEILHDFAVGASSEHEQALSASTELRANIMEEVNSRVSLHSLCQTV